MLNRTACAITLLAVSLVCELASIWLWSGAELRLGAPPVVQGVLLAVLCRLIPETRGGRWVGAGVAMGWLMLGALLDAGYLMGSSFLVGHSGFAMLPFLLPFVLFVPILHPENWSPYYLLVSAAPYLAVAVLLTRREPGLTRMALFAAAVPFFIRLVQFAKWFDETS